MPTGIRDKAPEELFCRNGIGLEKVYEVWKKKIEKLKRVTRKFEDKTLNKLEKHVEYERTTPNPEYKT
ncbi:4700_t:CDS:2 [Gigaspora rosea]|nr:4700_t:CDS:2 [Gigaspora rosea]